MRSVLCRLTLRPLRTMSTAAGASQLDRMLRTHSATGALQLDAREERLIRALDDFSRHLRQSDPALAPELRIAGGWVRDKVRRATPWLR